MQFNELMHTHTHTLAHISSLSVCSYENEFERFHCHECHMPLAFQQPSMALIWMIAAAVVTAVLPFTVHQLKHILRSRLVLLANAFCASFHDPFVFVLAAV